MKKYLTVFIFSITLLLLSSCNTSEKSIEVPSANPIIKPAISSPLKKETAIPTSSNTPKDNNLFNSGLLLGLRTDENNNNNKFDSYRTLWIAQKDGELQIIYEMPFIIFPHGSNFWKFENTTYNTKNLRYQSLTPHISNIETKAKPNYIESEDVVSDESDKLMFVSSKFASIAHSSYQYGDGAAHPSTFDNIRVKEIDKWKDSQVTLTDIFHDNVKETLKKNFIVYSGEDKINVDPDLHKEDESGSFWSIQRSNGKWTTMLAKRSISFNYSHIYYSLEQLQYKLPTSLIDYDTLEVEFSEIKKKMPDVIDAISSPTKDFIVIIKKNEVQFFKIDDFTNPLLTIPLKENETMIMDQWSTGEYVLLWSKELQKNL